MCFSKIVLDLLIISMNNTTLVKGNYLGTGLGRAFFIIKKDTSENRSILFLMFLT